MVLARDEDHSAPPVTDRRDTRVADRDPSNGGYSLANVRELLLWLLDAIGARSVAEIGAHRGELTHELLHWGATAGASIAAVDPEPPADLLALARQHPELELLRETSHEALGGRPLPDAVIIDGDHNYYTVSEELRLIAERAPRAGLPLVMFHDVGWPLARRDSYHLPERIPEEHRQPLAPNAGLSADPGFADVDHPFAWTAAHEGGPRNGGLTAIEDFVEAHDGVRLAVVPLFYGFGVVWHCEAPWAGAVAELVVPLDCHPVLERVEANRVAHLMAKDHLTRELASQARELAHLQARLARQERLLRTLLGSGSFALAERVSRLRQRGRPAFSRDEVRSTLDD